MLLRTKETAQPAWRLPTGWKAFVRFYAVQALSLPHSVHAEFEALSALISNGYRELFSLGYSYRGVKFTTHLYLVPRSRQVELYLHSPICLHGIMLT
jgi:hypothetical protein